MHNRRCIPWGSEFAIVPFEIFWRAVGLDNLIKIITSETSKYANKNGRYLETTKEEVLAFLGINFITFVNRLPYIENYWSTDWFMGNKAIQNVTTRTKFQAILGNLRFGDNQKKDDSDEGFKV